MVDVIVNIILDAIVNAIVDVIVNIIVNIKIKASMIHVEIRVYILIEITPPKITFFPWQSFLKTQFRRAKRPRQIRGYARMMIPESMRHLVKPSIECNNEENFEEWEEVITFAMSVHPYLLAEEMEEDGEEADEEDDEEEETSPKEVVPTPLLARKVSAPEPSTIPVPIPPPPKAVPPPPMALPVMSETASAAASILPPPPAFADSPAPEAPPSPKGVPPPSVSLEQLKENPFGLR